MIVSNSIPITTMPSVLQSSVFQSSEENVIKFWNDTKRSMCKSSLNELGDAVDICNVPSIERLVNATKESPTNWNAYDDFRISDGQSMESFGEQKFAIQNGVKTINRYISIFDSTTVLKNQVLAGAPGSGKSFLMMYLVLYSMSVGLNPLISSMMARRSVFLGSIHLHVMFCLGTNKTISVHRAAELAIEKLMRNGVKLKTLQMLDILFIDEIGQNSCELMSTIDIILRKIRKNTQLFGGVLVIGTMDHKQISSINGRPFLLWTYILTSFEFVTLEQSVRATNDPDFARLQHIARLSPSKYENDPSLLPEFKHLVESTCSFAPTWDDQIITPNTFRLYGKRVPAKEASQRYMQQIRRRLAQEDIVECKASDIMRTASSHHEWVRANSHVSKKLDSCVRETQSLLFFKGAIYEFTFNKDRRFSHSQLALLLTVPTQADVNEFKSIDILVAPPGIHDVEYDPLKMKTNTY